MKKLLAIVVLGLLWGGNLFANNLVGKQLQCNVNSILAFGKVEYLKFINDRVIHAFYIDKTTLKVQKSNYRYIVFPTYIKLTWVSFDHYTISRKTLKTSEGKSCKIVEFNIQNKLEKESQKLLKAAQKDNKI